MASSYDKIGLFGGSFDPPHWGHLLLALRAMESVGLNRIIFIPCYQSPLKSAGAQASGEHRQRMLELATEHLPGSEVSGVELKREGPSYTIDTVREIKGRMPEVSLHWIMGADQWNLLEQWREYEFLIKELNFIVITRDAGMVQRPGVFMKQVDFRFDISSTEIRERVRQGQDINCFTPQAVVDYINRHTLYLE